MIRPKVEFLSAAAVGRVIDEAFELLWDPGVRIHFEPALRLLGDAGATVDLSAQVARIPRSLVEKALETAPSSFFLYDLDGEPKVHYAGDKVHFNPGSAATKVVDYATQQERAPLTADCEDYVRLVEMLPQIDAVATSIICSDVPQSMSDWYRLYLVLRYARKPIVTGAFSIGAPQIMHELLAAVAGGAEALRAKPRAVFDVCPSPPLLWSEITCSNLMDYARLGIPAELVSMPLIGATGPATIIGSTVQHAAECLSGITIHQLTQPGSPIVWGGSPAAFDMRTGTTPMGAIATMMLDCSYAQVGKAIKPGGLPTHAYLCMSDAKVVDAQSGLETAAGAILGALAGINMISGPGMLDFESSFSLEQLVVDAETVGMAKRLIRGVDDSEVPFALDVIREVGHEGNFLKTRHTKRHFKSEDYIPSDLIDRDVYQAWFDKGALDARARAHRRVETLLSQYGEPPLSPQLSLALDEIAVHYARKAGLETLPVRTMAAA